MVKVIDGDICNAKTDVIVHQVNCHGVMGSGVAKAIKEKWPLVYQQYVTICSHVPPQQLIGKAQPVAVSPDKDDFPKFIVNLFGQLNYGRQPNVQYTSISALEDGLQLVYDFAKQYNYSVAMPYKIGCGLGGADWDIVYRIILTKFKDVEVELWRL